MAVGGKVAPSQLLGLGALPPNGSRNVISSTRGGEVSVGMHEGGGSLESPTLSTLLQ